MRKHSNSPDRQLPSPFKLTWLTAPITIQTHVINSSYHHSNSHDYQLTISIQTHLINSYLHSNSPDHLLLSPFKLTWSSAPITIQTHLVTTYCYLNSPDHQLLSPFKLTWSRVFATCVHVVAREVFIILTTPSLSMVNGVPSAENLSRHSGLHITVRGSSLTNSTHVTPTAWKEKTMHSKLTLAQVATFTLIRSTFFHVSIVQHKPRGQILQSECKAL